MRGLEILIWLSFFIPSILCAFKPEIKSLVEQSDVLDVVIFDDSSIILKRTDEKLERSEDNGLSWKRVDIENISQNWQLQIDPNQRKTTAYFFGSERGVFRTTDKGLSWNLLDLKMDEDRVLFYGSASSHPEKDDVFILSLITGKEEALEPSDSSNPIDLSPRDFSLVRLYGLDSYICTDGKTVSKIEIPILGNAEDLDFVSTECKFVRQTLDSKLWDEDDIICEVSGSRQSTELNRTPEKHIFKGKIGSNKFEELSGFRGANVDTFVILENFIVVLTSDDKFNSAAPRSLWISSEETKGRFEQSHLPTQLRTLFVQIFEHSHRILLSVVLDDESNHKNSDTGSVTSLVLISNTYGENFRILELDEPDSLGFVTLDSVPLFNNTLMASWYGIALSGGITTKTSKISFDSGRKWQNLQVIDPDNKWKFECDISDVENCSLFAARILDPTFSGVVSRGFTPGIQAVMGEVIGEHEIADPHLSTYVTRDAGKTWKKVIDSDSSFAFGDYGNIIVAVSNSQPTGNENNFSTTLYYSLDQGETFDDYIFEKPFFVTDVISNTFDSSGNTFTVIGFQFGEVTQRVLHIIDFSKAFDGNTCTDKDMESWYLSDGECINGARLMFKRRKQEAKCLVNRLYEDLSKQEELCECTINDYECSPGFSFEKDGNCVPDYSSDVLSSACDKKKSLEMVPKQIQKNTECKKALTIAPVNIDCSMVRKMDQSVQVVRNEFDFTFKSYQYFDTFVEEIILMRSSKNEVYVSYDGGENINKINADGESILEVNFNPYFNSSAYLFGASGVLYTTADRARNFKATNLPQARELGFPLSFSAQAVDTFIYYGGENCDNFFDPQCHSVAFLTRDGGATFTKMLEGALNCEFVGSTLKTPYNSNLVVCEVKDKETGKKSFVSSTDYFNSKTVLYNDIVGFMSTGDYLVVAKRYEEEELRIYLTIDGNEYAEAVLPSDLNSYEQKEFTVLGSQWGAIFMHMSTNIDQHKEFGALMKSNSNGTSFVILERAVNRNSLGFVDFESVEGLEGIIVINTVPNSEELNQKNEKSLEKRLKSKITFNDGADWSYIKPPRLDSVGKKYSCNPNDLKKCSLNLHGFTERRDVRDTFSSGSASGYMIATGNVGEFLLPVNEASTFMTADGGTTWMELAKGTYQWEYGDHGSVIVLVKDGEKTKNIKYSIDGGRKWNEYEFTTEETYITDIVTVPRDSALRFLLFGAKTSVQGTTTVTFTLDFRNSFERQCDPSIESPDFGYFSLTHPNQKECLFGHQAEYLRKTADDCFIGMAPLDNKFKITKNCSCTRNDFECDYNFVRMGDGTCKLADGVSPANPEDICRKDSSLVEYFEPTGYRKIPLSTCEGGLHLEASENPKPCPGKESEFNDLHNINSSFLLIWFIIFGLLLGALSFVYYRGIRRNGGFSRFGEIRLGDNDLIEENETDRVVNKIVTGGVYGVSALFSGFHLVRREASNTFKRIKARFAGSSGPSYHSLLHDQFLDDADDLLVGHDEDAGDLESFMENDANFEIHNDDENEPQDPLNANTETTPYSDGTGDTLGEEQP